MERKILVALAWPYVNGEPHLGHIAGVNIPADIFARYQRLRGARVVMVSGSDMHGTPTALRAIDENLDPVDIAFRYHKIWKDCLSRIDISYDLYTHTNTANHSAVVQEIFLSLKQKGYIYEGQQTLPYSNSEQRFLPDRLVEGTCPFCANPAARGDQCDECGKTLDPSDLIDIRSKRDGSKPVFKTSDHFFIDLGAFQERLREWMGTKQGWRPAVLNQTLGMLRDGLHERAITRDLEWGVRVPVDGYENKRIYVWFEAVLGYLSATKEWAQSQPAPEVWRDFWESPDAESFYFQGKDNVPFHAIILPAILMGHGGLQLPGEVVANEFLGFGGKMSKSRGATVWLRDYLERYDSEALRYYLTSIMPETSDSEFSWAGYLAAVNNELVSTLGNFVHRTLTIATHNFAGCVPSNPAVDRTDRELLEACSVALEKVGQAIENKRFKEALKLTMGVAQQGNRYLERRAPWHTVKTDHDRTATTIWTALQVVETLKVCLSPFLPRSAAKLHQMLGLGGRLEEQGWKTVELKVGAQLAEPQILFKKLDASIVAEEQERAER